MFKKFSRQLLITAVSVCMFFSAFCFPANVYAEERSAYDIIKEIIEAYGSYKDAGSPMIEILFQELEEADSAKAETWRKIYDYWKYANDEMSVCIGSVPDGLPEDNSLCFVVLGYGLKPDGTMKPELIGRLSVARECAEKYPNSYILCSGGGTASENASATEAYAMADWLSENGVRADRIIVEDRSQTTAQNAIYSCAILAENYPQISSLAIVSSDYHIVWGSVVFQAECIMINERDPGSNLSVVANAAYETDKNNGKLLARQANGLKEILKYSKKNG